jgi:hypothetical protein
MDGNSSATKTPITAIVASNSISVKALLGVEFRWFSVPLVTGFVFSCLIFLERNLLHRELKNQYEVALTVK